MCCVILCCVVLYCAVLCYIVLCSAVLCCVVCFVFRCVPSWSEDGTGWVWECRCVVL